MFSHDLNFSPNVVNNNCELPVDFNAPNTNSPNSSPNSAANTASLEASLELQSVPEIQSLQDVIPSAEFITEDLVIKTLRSAARPETIYWMLRHFAEANSHNPVINTDRGKTIYIELDRLEESVSVFVGNTDDVFLVGDESGSKVYSMDVQEKYDFVWYSFLGVALKKRMSAMAIQEQAKRENEIDEATHPALFYTLGKMSACTLRTNWYHFSRSLADGGLNGKISGKSGAENETRSNVLSVFGNRGN